jgi:synaptobrevin family protein YKT6
MAAASTAPKLIMNVIFKQNAEDTAPHCLCVVTDLSGFSYFTRGTVREHLRFASRTIVQRTIAGTRQSVGLKDNPFLCHTWVRADGLAGLLVADQTYPVRVAFSLISKTLSEYESKVGAKWKEVAKDLDQEPAFMTADLAKYQNPAEADKLLKVQKSLDDVKDIMSRNIEEVLKRGETLDSLMEKSADLSQVSVQFYKKAKKTNACCASF